MAWRGSQSKTDLCFHLGHQRHLCYGNCVLHQQDTPALGPEACCLKLGGCLLHITHRVLGMRKTSGYPAVEFGGDQWVGVEPPSLAAVAGGMATEQGASFCPQADSLCAFQWATPTFSTRVPSSPGELSLRAHGHLHAFLPSSALPVAWHAWSSPRLCTGVIQMQDGRWFMA